jgi:N-acetylglucosamine-6-phosphate deacetylase
MYALTNCILYTGSRELHDHALVIERDKVLDIIPQAQLGSEVDRLDGQGCAAAPGFIDLQLNGCGGVMFNDAITVETLETMHRANLKSGTTSFLPTLITAPDEAMEAAINRVAAYRRNFPHSVLGLHLEGPYLNPKRKGIHNGAYVRRPDDAMVNRILNAGGDVVKILTLAPEMVPAETIRQLKEAGIVVSAGHTQATFEEALNGFAAGAAMATHLFNAMSPWQGRQPGMVGAVFSHPDIYAGIIADGHHVHYGSISLAHKIKQDKLLLVTDATPPAGTQMDSFMIGGQQVFYRDGKCVSADGTLGGSALTLIEAVQNCVQYVGISLAEALRMASLYPARAIGVDHQLGLLSPGYIANVTLFDSETFTVRQVIDRGRSYALSSPEESWAGSMGRVK